MQAIILQKQKKIVRMFICTHETITAQVQQRKFNKYLIFQRSIMTLRVCGSMTQWWSEIVKHASDTDNTIQKPYGLNFEFQFVENALKLIVILQK